MDHVLARQAANHQASDHAQGFGHLQARGPGERVGGVQVTELRVAGLGRAGSAEYGLSGSKFRAAAAELRF